MLVLSRKTGERIVIDGKITITVVQARHGRVRLGIEAPPGIPVWRTEVVAEKEVSVREHYQPQQFAACCHHDLRI